MLSELFTAQRISSLTSLLMNESAAWLLSSAFHSSNSVRSRKRSRLKAPSVIVFPGPRIRGDGGAVQRRPEEAGLAIAPDLPRAQHCLQGRPAAVLLRALLPPTLPGTRSTYTRLDYLHKRDRALVLLPYLFLKKWTSGERWIASDRGDLRAEEECEF